MHLHRQRLEAAGLIVGSLELSEDGKAMKYYEVATSTWPEAIIFLGVLLAVLFLIGVAVARLLEFRKTKLLAAQDDNARQLARRYEQLAESTLDAQQRVAADVSELRSRATSIEQILRTVEQ